MQRQLAALLFVCFTAGCAPSRPAMEPTHDTRGARTGVVALGVVGAVAAAAAVGFTIASAVENDSVQRGGFATGKDIQSAADRGTTFNEGAFVSGAVALGVLGAALGLYFYAWPSQKPEKARRLGEIAF